MTSEFHKLPPLLIPFHAEPAHHHPAWVVRVGAGHIGERPSDVPAEPEHHGPALAQPELARHVHLDQRPVQRGRGRRQPVAAHLGVEHLGRGASIDRRRVRRRRDRPR